MSTNDHLLFFDADQIIAGTDEYHEANTLTSWHLVDEEAPPFPQESLRGISGEINLVLPEQANMKKFNIIIQCLTLSQIR